MMTYATFLPRKRQGISLIEILVVLVILLIGILSIVRLFPPGFLANKNAEAQTLASRLAKQETDRFASSSANLMDSIVPIKPIDNGGKLVFIVDLDATPDDMSDTKTAVLGADPYFYSNVNKHRRIINETVRIPIPSPTAAGRGSIYTLSSGPVYYRPSQDVIGEDTIIVSGSPLQSTVQRVEDPPQFSGPSQYAIDYETDEAPGVAQIAVSPVPYPRRFVLNYSYYDSNDRIQTVVDQKWPDTADFPNGELPANDGDWHPIKLPTGGKSMVPGSERVARKFKPLAKDSNGAFNWSQDPYEYGVLSDNENTFANVGVMAFNPKGYGYTEYGANGPVPLTAFIDYDVLDWHIIREDRVMPASPPYTVTLSLKNIKQLGDFETDQSTYVGIFRDDTIPFNARQEVLIYDLATGTPIDKSLYNINYKNGLVTFDQATGDAHKSGTLRFFYKAEGEWALQIQKASASYRPHIAVASGDELNVGLSEYALSVKADASGNRPRLYFPLMEAGKTVSIRQLFYSLQNDGSGPSRRVANATFKINDDRSKFEQVTVNGQTRLLTFIDLRDNGYPDARNWNYTTTGQAVAGMQGVSFRSRVLWNNGTAITESSNGNVERVRWRRIDNDTFLTRLTN